MPTESTEDPEDSESDAPAPPPKSDALKLKHREAVQIEAQPSAQPSPPTLPPRQSRGEVASGKGLTTATPSPNNVPTLTRMSGGPVTDRPRGSSFTCWHETLLSLLPEPLWEGHSPTKQKSGLEAALMMLCSRPECLMERVVVGDMNKLSKVLGEDPVSLPASSSPQVKKKFVEDKASKEKGVNCRCFNLRF